MTRKIFLSAGHGGKDPGAVFGNYIERDLAIELRSMISGELRTTYNISALSDPPSNALSQTLAWLRGRFTSRDILLDIHWNAGGGTGTEVIVPNTSSAFERALSQALADRISLITSWRKRGGGVKPESSTARKTLGWMRPVAENILLEVCFIDSRSDMETYQTNKIQIAKGIAEVLANFSKL
jgi:N-acetylmuramoyl-L-alanine amidase